MIYAEDCKMKTFRRSRRNTSQRKTKVTISFVITISVCEYTNDLCIYRLLPKYISRKIYSDHERILSGVSCTKHGFVDFKESSFHSHVRRLSPAKTAVNRPRVRENCGNLYQSAHFSRYTKLIVIYQITKKYFADHIFT